MLNVSRRLIVVIATLLFAFVTLSYSSIDVSAATKANTVKITYYTGTKNRKTYELTTYYTNTNTRKDYSYYEYDKNTKTQLKKIKLYDTNGRLYQQNIYEQYRYAGNSWSSSKRSYIYYDVNKNIRTSKTVKWFNPNGTLKQRNVQTYYNGKLSTIERNYYTNGVIASSLVYGYLSNGYEVIQKALSYTNGVISSYWDYRNNSYNIKYLYTNGKAYIRYFYKNNSSNSYKTQYYVGNVWSDNKPSVGDKPVNNNNNTTTVSLKSKLVASPVSKQYYLNNSYGNEYITSSQKVEVSISGSSYTAQDLYNKGYLKFTQNYPTKTKVLVQGNTITFTSDTANCTNYNSKTIANINNKIQNTDFGNILKKENTAKGVLVAKKYCDTGVSIVYNGKTLLTTKFIATYFSKDEIAYLKQVNDLRKSVKAPLVEMKSELNYVAQMGLIESLSNGNNPIENVTNGFEKHYSGSGATGRAETYHGTNKAVYEYHGYTAGNTWDNIHYVVPVNYSNSFNAWAKSAGHYRTMVWSKVRGEFSDATYIGIGGEVNPYRPVYVSGDGHSDFKGITNGVFSYGDWNYLSTKITKTQ